MSMFQTLSRALPRVRPYAIWALALMIVTFAGFANAAVGRGDGNSGDDTSGNSVQSGNRNIDPKDLDKINETCWTFALIDFLEQKFPGCEPVATEFGKARCSRDVPGFGRPEADPRLSARPGSSFSTARWFGIGLSGSRPISNSPVSSEIPVALAAYDLPRDESLPWLTESLPILDYQVVKTPTQFNRLGKGVRFDVSATKIRIVTRGKLSTETILTDSQCEDPNGYESGSCVALVNTEQVHRCLQQGLADLPFNTK